MTHPTTGLPPVLLVAEDDDVLRKLLTALLRRNFKGYEVQACADGVEADLADQRLRAQGRDVALVLSDLVMPRMDGLELFGRIAERDPDCALVILTGEAALDSAVASLRLGVEDYLTKPFTERELVHTLARHLERRRLRRANERLERELTFTYRFVSRLVEAALDRMSESLTDVLDLPNVDPRRRKDILSGRRALDQLARAYRVAPAAGGVAEDAETLTLQSLVSGCVRGVLANHALSDDRVTVYAPERSVNVSVDAAGARIALTQLLENAIEQGPSRAEVALLGEGRNWPAGFSDDDVPTAVRQKLQRDHVAVSVRNTAGLTRDDEAYIRRVLEGRPESQDRFRGLGLPLARLYATILGGEIIFQWRSARSEVTFTLVLPRSPEGPRDRRSEAR